MLQSAKGKAAGQEAMNKTWSKLRLLMKIKKADSSLPYAKPYSYPGHIKLYALRPSSSENSFTAGKTLFEKEAWHDESLPFRIEFAVVGTTFTITLNSTCPDYHNCFAQIQLLEIAQVAYEVVIIIRNGSGYYLTHVDEVPRPRWQAFNMNVRTAKTFDLLSTG